MTAALSPAAAWQSATGYKLGVANPCPARRITGRHDRPHAGMYQPCCNGRRLSAFDHVWSIVRGPHRGILTMPYQFTLDDAVELTLWCHEHRATFSVLGAGWHHEGTIAIAIFPETP